MRSLLLALLLAACGGTNTLQPPDASGDVPGLEVTVDVSSEGLGDAAAPDAPSLEDVVAVADTGPDATVDAPAMDAEPDVVAVADVSTEGLGDVAVDAARDAMPVCRDGFGNCDGVASNGCESELATDARNCGACGRRCLMGEVCSRGTCAFDCGTLTLCPSTGACADFATDVGNCGRCGNACLDGRACISGMCACPPGTAFCGRVCLAVGADVFNCGACGNSCAVRPHSSRTCRGGVCGIVCDTGFADCDRDTTNGCEVDLSLPSNCGECGRACPSGEHGRAACESGRCLFLCDRGYGDCDRATSNGCEVYTDGDMNNCGACGAVCASPSGGRVMACRGECVFVGCVPGWARCSGTVQCLVDTNTDRRNCGRCDNVCPGGSSATCVMGTCR